MPIKSNSNSTSRHEGSIPFTRYAGRNGSSVVNNVVKTDPKLFIRRRGSRFSSHAGTVGLSVIRRIKWAVFPPKLSYWPAFFGLFVAFLSPLSGATERNRRSSYERAVNVTLDTVMWIHERHRGKITWLELNAEVCRAMKVKRIEPWQQR